MLQLCTWDHTMDHLTTLIFVQPKPCRYFLLHFTRCSDACAILSFVSAFYWALLTKIIIHHLRIVSGKRNSKLKQMAHASERHAIHVAQTKFLLGTTSVCCIVTGWCKLLGEPSKNIDNKQRAWRLSPNLTKMVFQTTWIRRPNHTLYMRLFQRATVWHGILISCLMSMIGASPISSTSCLAVKVKRNSHHSVLFDNYFVTDRYFFFCFVLLFFLSFFFFFFCFCLFVCFCFALFCFFL